MMMSEAPDDPLRSPALSQAGAITWEDFDGKALTNISSPRSWQVRLLPKRACRHVPRAGWFLCLTDAERQGTRA